MTWQKHRAFAGRLAILLGNHYSDPMTDNRMTPSALASTQPRALVTGASEGIGRAFALQLAQKGYAVTVVARNEARLDTLLSELYGKGHTKMVADLSKSEGILRIATELTYGAIPYQLLVNNAGFGALGEFAKIPMEKNREMIGLNIMALVELSHAFLQRAERGSGIIQVSSTLSFLPMPAQAVYSATKAFVTSFSESLWYQCRAKGITIINLCPGATITNFQVRSGGKTGGIPSFVLETADEVAGRALRALERKAGPTIISGWKNQIGAFIARLVTRKQLVKIMGGIRQ